MKLCIDPGHGFSNRTPGVFDPGAVCGPRRESDTAFVWACSLQSWCDKLNLSWWMTRDEVSDAPLAWRAREAQRQGCTHLISLHVNDAKDASSHGVETLVRTGGKTLLASHPAYKFGQTVQAIAVTHLGLRDRGVKLRNDLAVLGNTKLTSCLLELGFIQNEADMRAVTDPGRIDKTCEGLARWLKTLK